MDLFATSILQHTITLFQIWILKQCSASECSLLMLTSEQVPCLLQELQQYFLSIISALTLHLEDKWQL